MRAVFKREFRSYFTSPIGYIVLAIMVFFESMSFELNFRNASPNVEDVISFMQIIVIFATPFITMRLFSEDRRLRVDQVLLTSPVKITSMVLGKFLAAFALYALGFVLTVVFQFIVASYVAISWSVFLYALFGILLLGAAMLAIGMFFSTFTESPAVAAAITFAAFLAILLLDTYISGLSNTGGWLIKIIIKIVSAISFMSRFSAFTEGIFNFNDVFYMLSISGLFIFLTVCSISRRRWA